MSTNWLDFGAGIYALLGGSNIGVIISEGRAVMVDAGLDRSVSRKALREIEALHARLEALVLTHGHVSMWHYALNYLRLLVTGRKINVRAFRERLAKLYPSADLIIFGHTHFQLHEIINGRHFVNPGAAYPHLLNHHCVQYCELIITAAGQILVNKQSLPGEQHV